MTLILIFVIIILLAVGIYGWLGREVRYNMPWMRFRKAVEDTYPAAKDFFEDGASDADLKRLQARFPGPLPPSFMRMLSDTNGGANLFFGTELLSVDGILREYDNWQVIVEGGLEDFTDPYCSFPPNTIQPKYVDQNWVPFAHDGAGNFIALDFAPGPNGKQGQVISFGADEIEMLQLAENFPKFLQLMHALVGHNQVTYEEDTGRYAFPIYIVDAVKSLKKKMHG